MRWESTASSFFPSIIVYQTRSKRSTHIFVIVYASMVRVKVYAQWLFFRIFTLFVSTKLATLPAYKSSYFLSVFREYTQGRNRMPHTLCTQKEHSNKNHLNCRENDIHNIQHNRNAEGLSATHRRLATACNTLWALHIYWTTTKK